MPYVVGREGFEPSNPSEAGLQSARFNHLHTDPKLLISALPGHSFALQKWFRDQGSNLGFLPTISRPGLYRLSYHGTIWCMWTGSNCRPHPYQGCALPTELHVRVSFWEQIDSRCCLQIGGDDGI